MTSHLKRWRGRLALALAAATILCTYSVNTRAQGPLPDLMVGASRLSSSLRISTHTYSSGSCSVVEGCIVPGQRRILEFDTQIINQGNADAVLGTPQNRPELFVFSPCHGHYHMLDSLDYSMAFGGTDSMALYDNTLGTYFLRNDNSAGNADMTFTFGAPGAVPICGDWDGNGTVTVGSYVPATGVFFLRNSNSPGPADITFSFGAGGAGYVPVVGDWDGSTTDTVGLYAPSTGVFFLKNSNAVGPADMTFQFGVGGSLVPVAGDWNGDDNDSVGLYDPATGNFFLKNTNSGGPADTTFAFGVGGSVKPIVGDWNASGDDNVGVYDPATGSVFQRNSNTPGPADNTFVYGGGGSNLVAFAGDWDYDMKGGTVPGIVGLKQAFCWLDSQRVSGNLPAHYNCSNQGITAGWSDVYGRGLDCQWIDITGLAGGNYQLRVSVNDSHTIVTESNYDNNVSVVKVHITAAAGKQAVEPVGKVTAPFNGDVLKVGQPVTITWEVKPGSTPTHQEIWFIPSPKGTTPTADPFHNDPHHDAIARSKIIAENLPPNVRSFTWIPNEDYVMDIGAQIMVRVQDKRNTVGTDQRMDGTVTVVRK